MKSILVPQLVTDDNDGALTTAIAVARRFESYVEGLVVEPVSQLVNFDSMAAIPLNTSKLLVDWQKRTEKARNQFGCVMNQEGILVGDSAARHKGLSAGWQELKGVESTVVAEYGRLFDLIAIARASGNDSSKFKEILEAAIFESGRLVLLATNAQIRELGRSIVISWNGSTEAARTVGLGMPFIENAESVFVLTVEGATLRGPSGDQVIQYLSRRGVKARAVVAQPGNRTAGEAILKEASDLGADLLIKGAYTHNRLRQLVFGGATEHILSHAELPVLMAH